MPIIKFGRPEDAPAGVETRRYDDSTVTWPTFVGKCVAERERNMRDDSDFFMTVETSEGVFQEFQYATTRGWTYPAMASAVDATPDVLERWNAHLASQRQERAAQQEFLMSCLPKKGSRVRVVKGRKVPVGTEATVFWVGETEAADRYSRWSTVKTFRIGLRLSNGSRVFTDMRNVRVVSGEKLLPVVYLSGGLLGSWVDAEDKFATV